MKHGHKAFNLIELLVVLSLIALLVALLLPAIQSARETGRMLNCRGNLKQLGLALSNYEFTYRMAPSGRSTPVPLNFSAFSHLLPFLEQSALHARIDFSQPPTDSASDSGPKAPTVNRVIASAYLPFLVCPSDLAGGRVPGVRDAGTNYAGNSGSGLLYNGSLVQADGIFYENSSVRFRDIRDGITQTVAFAERLCGPGTAKINSVPPYPLLMSRLVNGLDPTYSNCYVASGPQPVAYSWGLRGAQWMLGDYTNTLYNHYHVPDAHLIDCIDSQATKGLLTVSSRHVAGPNIVFCDGHVTTISNDIDQSVWRYLGSRDGGEITREQ